MNLRPDKTEFTDAEQAQLRADVLAQIEADRDLKQADVSRESEIPAPTLSQFLSGKYTGDNSAIAAKLHKWLNARLKTQELRQRLPVVPVYQPLATAELIIQRLRYARHGGRMVSICSEPGLSKTSAARQFQSENPRTWLATMSPAASNVTGCMIEILDQMGEPDAHGQPQALVRRVERRASEATGLLIVDEAQHLADTALEQLRTINDRCRAKGAKFGIALMGNIEAYQRTAHDGSRTGFAQVSSRMGMRMWLVKPEPADVEMLAMAWGQANDELIDDAIVAYCQTIAAKPGGLRNIEMTMESALMAAWGAVQPLQVEHLKWAFGQLSGGRS